LCSSYKAFQLFLFSFFLALAKKKEQEAEALKKKKEAKLKEQETKQKKKEEEDKKKEKARVEERMMKLLDELEEVNVALVGFLSLSSSVYFHVFPLLSVFPFLSFSFSRRNSKLHNWKPGK
jgi:hypothetical protein